MEGGEQIDWRCDGCNRILETGDRLTRHQRLTPPPRYDVPDDKITWNVTPTPQKLMLGCTCGHYTVFAASSTIERWKARRKAQPS